MKIGKLGLEKTLENYLIGQMIFKDMKLMLMEKELINLNIKKVNKVQK